MRHIFSIAALTVILMIVNPAPVFPGGAPPSETSDSIVSQYNSTEAELKLLYDRILQAYKADTEFIEKFKKAHTAWNQYRRTHLESLYPAKDKLEAYGSVYHRCYLMALIELNRYRIDQLRVWVDGLEEGDVCSGSVKFR